MKGARICRTKQRVAFVTTSATTRATTYICDLLPNNFMGLQIPHVENLVITARQEPALGGVGVQTPHFVSMGLEKKDNVK